MQVTKTLGNSCLPASLQAETEKVKLSLKQWLRWINAHSQSILSIWRNNYQMLLGIFPQAINKAMHVIWKKVNEEEMCSLVVRVFFLTLCKQGWVIRQSCWGALQMWMGSLGTTASVTPLHTSTTNSQWARDHFPIPHGEQYRTECSGLGLMNY